MSYSQAWLENQNNIKIVLVECKVYSIALGQDTSVFLSNKGYLTGDGNTYFEPIIIGAVSINERLRFGSSVSLSFGDIVLANHSGVLDEYLGTDYVWTNREIKVYFGDPTWVAPSIASIRSEAQFKLVFSGVISDISSSGKDVLNIKIRNKLEKLNTPVTEQKIGTYGVWAGGQQNQDQITPLVFGEVHNLTPILIDPSTLEYKFNSNLIGNLSGDTEYLIEVRDNGIPVSLADENLQNGTFKLRVPAAGTITCSVQGIKNAINLVSGNDTLDYENNLVKIIANIARNYGSNPNNRLLISELDLPQLNSFSTESANIGIALLQRENVLTTIQRIADSVGAQVYASREGKLQILRYGSPEVSVPSVDITTDDIVEGSLSLAERPSVKASTKIGYGRNWTAQQGLLTAIPEAQKEAFAIEWLTTTYTNTTTKSIYKLEADPGQEDTLLITTAEAEAEAERRNGLVSVQRAIFRMVCRAKMLSLKLGQEVKVYYPRFGLKNGLRCQVVGLSPDWANQTVEVEVLSIELPSRQVNLIGSGASQLNFTTAGELAELPINLTSGSDVQVNLSSSDVVSLPPPWPLVNYTYYESYSVSNTSSASNTATVHKVLDIPLEVGDTIEVSTVLGWPVTMPSVNTVGDTYLRLKGPSPSTSDVASSDDHTGNKAYISYTAVTAGLYSIWSGAYGSGSASGTYGWRVTRPVNNLVGSSSTQTNASDYYVDPSTVTVTLSAAPCIQDATSVEVLSTLIILDEFNTNSDMNGRVSGTGQTWYGSTSGALTSSSGSVGPTSVSANLHSTFIDLPVATYNNYILKAIIKTTTVSNSGRNDLYIECKTANGYNHTYVQFTANVTPGALQLDTSAGIINSGLSLNSDINLELESSEVGGTLNYTLKINGIVVSTDSWTHWWTYEPITYIRVRFNQTDAYTAASQYARLDRIELRGL